MATAPFITSLLANVPALTSWTPFITNKRVQLRSTAAANVYGVNSPGNSAPATYQAFKQLVAGNFGFELSASANAPQNTSGGALSAANQLRVVCIVNGGTLGNFGTILTRLRGDQDPTASTFIVGAGGGTLVGDVTMSLNVALTAGSAVTVAIKSSGANVKTIIPGDRMTITEGTVTETVTLTRQATMNGTTPVAVSFTPTAFTYTTAAVLTFVAATGKAIVLATTTAVPNAGGLIEVWVNAAADIVTFTGGALTANRPYEVVMNTVMHADAISELLPLVA